MDKKKRQQEFFKWAEAWIRTSGSTHKATQNN